MAPITDRFRTQRYVTGFAAEDTIEHIAERVHNLVRHGRRITLVSRYTYETDRAPDVTAGLVLDEVGGEPLGGPFRIWKSVGGARGFSVRLAPGIMHSFGVATDNADTEGEVAARYRKEKADDFGNHRPRNITHVEIEGGLPGDGPARDDKLVIEAWNTHGVCTQTVVAFDYTPERPRFNDPHVAWLRAHRDQHPDGSDAWYALATVYMEYLRQAAVKQPLDQIYTEDDMSWVDRMIPANLLEQR